MACDKYICYKGYVRLADKNEKDQAIISDG